MRRKDLAFVLGGGGARGALQAGALRALLEAGFRPQTLVGTSIGAVNAAFLALNGLNTTCIERLYEAWHAASQANLLPQGYLSLTIRTLLKRQPPDAGHRLREFFISQGLTPQLHFRDVAGVRLGIVAADLNSGKLVLYGKNPDDSILEALLASTALPPWISPIGRDGRLLMDGGMVCNLPIQPALEFNASEIIALNLADPRVRMVELPRFAPFLARLFNTLEQRQLEMELALAAAHHVPVHLVSLRGTEPVRVWDFAQTTLLMEHGYHQMIQAIHGWQGSRSLGWRNRLGSYLFGQG